MINQKNRPITLALMLGFIVLLAGCWTTGGSGLSSSSFNSPLSPAASPTPAPTKITPAADEAALQGRFIIAADQVPLRETFFYLTPAIGGELNEAPVALGALQENDIEGRTDTEGNFALNHVPPGKYYLVIWAPLKWNILSEPSQEEAPLLLELEAGETLDLGEMTIIWP